MKPKSGRPMFKFSRVMRESKSSNDITECLESFRDMNTNVTSVSLSYV